MNKPWMDTVKSIDERLALLLAQMTLEEKIGQMNQIANITPDHADDIRAGTIGSSLSASGPLAGNVQDAGLSVAMFNKVQKIAVEESRLGIPILFARDVIHGHRTVMPIPLGQAASWNPDLVREGAEVAAREAYADGVRWTFAPVMDVARDPRWGRIAESYGEDPYLNGCMAAASVHGLQGDDNTQPGRLAATAKHFAAYGAAEGGRDYWPSPVGEHSLRNDYLPPFRAAVRAGVATVMSSFNEIDGVPAAAHTHLLTEILKDEWGFGGFVVSDWGSIWQLTQQAVAETEPDAARLAIIAGNDMDMCDSIYFKHIAGLVRDGKIGMGVIDGAVARILRVKLQFGLFENPYTDESLCQTAHCAPASRATARKLAVQSMVLLKNNGILPLKKESRILLSGPLTRATQEILGTWTLDGRGEDAVSVEQALKARLGVTLTTDNPVGYGDLTPIVARDMDAVVFCIGESYWRSGEGNCVADIGIPANQLELMRMVRDMGVPIVSVVFAGRPCTIAQVVEWSDAVIYAWHPGVEAGNAVADLLLGDAVPSGRCPVSFPRHVGQIPVHYNYRLTGRPADIWNTKKSTSYRDMPDSPLFPFGFGLSYTTFSYRDLRLSAATMRPDGSIAVSAIIANTGARDGVEVVQLYIRDVVGSITRPVKELKGFRRLELKAGEEKSVEFVISSQELAFYGIDNTEVVEPGEFKVWIGPDCRDGLEGAFRVI